MEGVDRYWDVHAQFRGRHAVELPVAPDQSGIDVQAGIEKRRMDMVAGGIEPGRQCDFGEDLITVLPQSADAAESGAIGQAEAIEKSIEQIRRDLAARAHPVAGEGRGRGPGTDMHRAAGIEMPGIIGLHPGALQPKGRTIGPAADRRFGPYRLVGRDRQRALIDEVLDHRLRETGALRCRQHRVQDCRGRQHRMAEDTVIAEERGPVEAQ